MTYASTVENAVTEANWEAEPFTEEDRKLMLELMVEEVRGSIYDIAREKLSEITEMTELIAYADPDSTTTAELLEALRDQSACMDDFMSGEFDHHVESAIFMSRLGLVDGGGELTELGRKYLEDYR